MGLQLALAMSTNVQFHTCPACGRWFEVSVERGRLNQIHCNEACKARAYRRRKQEAAELAKKGWTPMEIAERIESDVKTVRGWLKQLRKA